MKILVTGGAGFIGSHFTELCIENKADVHIVDALTYASHKTIIENLEGISFTRGDINDIKFCSEILESYNPDFIVNLRLKLM